MIKKLFNFILDVLSVLSGVVVVLFVAMFLTF
jgi:hypothetical protein